MNINCTLDLTPLRNALLYYLAIKELMVLPTYNLCLLYIPRVVANWFPIQEDTPLVNLVSDGGVRVLQMDSPARHGSDWGWAQYGYLHLLKCWGNS